MDNTSPVNQVLGTAELLNIVLLFLRDWIQKDVQADGPMNESSRTGLPAKWKGQFMNVALVNRTFFHASVGVIWERMHSLDPFLSLLEPAAVTVETSMLSPNSEVPRNPWDRFGLYSSRTKSLNLKNPAPSDVVRSFWGYDREKSKGRPNPIFPALSTLYLKSTDHISMWIAMSVCQRVKRLEVELEPASVGPGSNEAIVELSAILAVRQNPLSLLRIRHAAGAQYLRNLSRLNPARHLLVTLSCEDIAAIGPSYWSHRQVAFEESFDGDTETEYQKACRVNLHELSRLNQHRFIIVHGRSSLQTLIANSYANSSPPKSPYDQIALELPQNGSFGEDLLNPGTIGTYLARNPDLLVLTVNCMTYAFRSQQMEAAERARANPAFCDIRAFLDPLSAAQNLTFLSVCGIVFKPRDIVLQMLVTLRRLPSLTAFTFFPAQMSTREEDLLLLPSFASLAEIHECNPRLRIFGTYMSLSMEVDDLPTFSSTFSSRHPLEKMTLFPGLRLEPDDFPTYSTKETLKIAMFMDRLFPNIQTEGRAVRGHDNAVSEFWDSVYETISSFQEVRERTTRECHYPL